MRLPSRSGSLLAVLVLPASLAVLLFGAQPAPACDEDSDEATLGWMLGEARDASGQTASPHSLVLRRVAHHATLAGPVAEVVVEQEFVNDTEAALEAVYLFPLPAGAAVHSFRMDVGGRVLEGVVREKQEARRSYEAARREGRRASLLEQHRPNMFASRVANVLPGDVIVVRLGYATVVPFESGWYHLRLPLVVALPPAPARTRASGAPLLANAEVPVPSVELTVLLDPGLPVQGIDSPSHRITAADDGRGVLVTLPEPARLDRDFLLHYALATERTAAAAAWVSPLNDDGSREALVLLAPPKDLPLADVQPREMLFVLDTSGSMADGSLDAAKRALAACIGSLGPRDLVNVIAYDNTFTRFSEAPVAATPSTRQSLSDWISGQVADGGTLLVPALAEALGEPTSMDHHRQVVVLTDGHVGDADDVLRLLAERLGEARLFMVAIGSAPNGHLAERMTEEGRGTLTYLTPGASLSRAVGQLLASIAQPLAWDVELDWHGALVDDVLPTRIPDLYAGRPVTLFAHLRGQGPLRVTVGAETPGGRAAWDLELDESEWRTHAVVSTLWAHAKVARLEREIVLLGARSDDPSAGQEAARLREELLAEALSHSLASSVTSFIVEELVPATDRPAKVRHAVPLEAPAAWPQTATTRPRVLVAGLTLILLGALLGAGLALWGAPRAGLSA